MTNKRKVLAYQSRRKYIQHALRLYRSNSINTRRLRRVLGRAYDDMANGTLNLF